MKASRRRAGTGRWSGRLAERTLRSGTLDSAEVAKRALAWLELLDAEQADLDTARREMVGWIMRLRAVVSDKSPSQPYATDPLRFRESTRYAGTPVLLR